MTTDMRISMLDELEAAEQFWTDRPDTEEKKEDPEEIMLKELLESALLSTSTSAPTQKTPSIVKLSVATKKTVPAVRTASSKVMASKEPVEANAVVSSPSKPHQSVFERLYHQETKASVGQQVESVRQQTLRKMKANPNPKSAAATTVPAPKLARVSSTRSTTGTVTTCSSSSAGHGHKAKSENMVTSFSTPKRNRPWNVPTSGDYKTGRLTPDRTPETIYADFSDDSSASTVSSLIGMESPSRHQDEDPSLERKSDLECLLLPKSSSSAAPLAPWKMALKRKMEEGESTASVASATRTEQLYLRSMANVLYDFASGNSNEVEVATELITALFHRDFECSKYWTEEPAEVTTTANGEYQVEKAAESSSDRGGSSTRTISSACIKFHHSSRMVIVQDYHHGIGDEC
jgi:hypothetical protein